MELYQIKHFVAVVEAASFTKGARLAAVSQPAISASIAKLEAELDVKLLERRRARVVPTAAGARFLEFGKAMLSACSSIKAELKTIAAPKLLRIGILQSFSSGHISNLLGSFRRENPNIALEVVDETNERLIELLTERQLDAVLTILDDDVAKFASTVLFNDPYVLAVSEEHRLAQLDSVTVEDLRDESFIVRTGCDKFKDASNVLVSRGVKTRVVYKTAQIDRTLALVAAGIGVSFVPARLATSAVKQIEVADFGFHRTFGLLWLPNRDDNILDAFLQFAETHGRSP